MKCDQMKVQSTSPKNIKLISQTEIETIPNNLYQNQISYIASQMNRKNQEKDQESEETAQQTIIPKFSPNWTSVVYLDRIVMNISDCEYEVVQKVGRQLKWKIKTDPSNPEWDVWWTDWAVTPEVLMKMEHHQKINHFPGMYTLSRKNLLAKNLMKMRKIFPNEYNYFPLTWNLPGDYLDFKTYYETKPKGKARTFIVKPQSMSQGKGIFLTRKLEDINPQQHCVVQRYLSRPYLIEGLKFDLRIYVLVAGVDPLRVFIFRQGLARFATENYVAPNKDNMEDICMHLTNYAINKQSDKFIFNSDENDMGIGHKRSIQSVFKIMKENGADIESLKLKIEDVIVKTLISGQSHLKFQYRSCQSQNFRGDMCFQLLGFDIIINEDLQPILLEINYTPSFSTDTPLDWNIKKSLIHDALVLMGVNKEFKEETVKVRKQYRDIRMMTGKKNKYTQEEKEERRIEALKSRDQYIDAHLGGFKRIYPLPSGDPRQEVYENLIKSQAEISGCYNESKKLKPISQQTLVRKNTQKLAKLPAIPSMKQSAKSRQNSNKIISAKRVDLSKGSCKIETEDENSKQAEEGGRQNGQLSEKFIKKARIRQVSIIKKRSIQTRETLVPKTIQFEVNCFDGICENYKKGTLRCQ